MLWLIIGEASYEVIGSNIHHLPDGVTHQLWITRPGGKTLMIKESNNEQEIADYKYAIDYAISSNQRSFEME